jgi:predicted SAM-dependent methyltransferase
MSTVRDDKVVVGWLSDARRRKAVIRNALRRTAEFLIRPLTSGRPQHVVSAAVTLWTEAWIVASLPWWRRQIERTYAGRHGLKLNLGCGPNIRPGWVNVDLFAEAPFHYDVRYGLPFADGSCSYVYSEHLLEHLPYTDGVQFLRECFRVLDTGGVLRTVVPNYIEIFRAYVYNKGEYFDLLQHEIPTSELMQDLKESEILLVDFVNYSVYQRGEHKVLTDAEKLRHLLELIGFQDFAVTPPDPQVDSMIPLRTQYSLYTQARKR